MYEIAILLDFYCGTPFKNTSSQFDIAKVDLSLNLGGTRCIGNIMMEPAPYMSLGCQESGTEMEQSGNKFASHPCLIWGFP